VAATCSGRRSCSSSTRWSERLSPEAAALIGRQVAGVELVQRHLDDREVNLYPNRRGRQRHDPAIAFPNRDDDLRLATVALAGPDGRGRAEVFAVNGHLFQLAFRPRPRELGDRAAITVQSVTMHADPMVEAEGDEVERRLAELDPALRVELEGMWADGSAARLGVGAPAELYRISLDDGDHLVMWQDDATFLVAGIDPPAPGVARVSPDEGLIREYPDLRSALLDSEGR
jgi:hypothetical protein